MKEELACHCYKIMMGLLVFDDLFLLFIQIPIEINPTLSTLVSPFIAKRAM